GYAICETGEQYENMTLRFTSSDGDRVYTKILTADDENIIYGIDREKTYTAEVCSRNGNVFCSKDNISFGESRSVSVAFENTKAPLDVKVIVVDENRDERDGFTASWIDKNGKYISDSKTLNERIGGEQLSCEIKLGNGLLRNYKAPKKANITVSEYSENTVTVTLEKYAAYTVSGTVKDSGDETLPNVKVTASQDIGGKTSVYNDVTDENGNYSLTLTEGDYQLTFCKNGYYDKTVNGTLSEDKTDNTTLEKLSGSKLGCTVSFNTLSASIQNNLSLNELSVSVFNQTKNKAVNDFTLQNNYFYFKNEDVSQGDTLKFTFADTSGVYEETQQTLTFNEGTFYFAVTMTEKGKISCKIKNTPNSGNVMLLFDENSKFVDSYHFRNLTFETDHLSAGSYSVVVMGESDPAVSADSLEAFGEYGFTENEDYRVYSAEVKSGELTEIDEIEIPEYNSDKLIYLDPDKTQLSANNTTVAIGQYTVLKAEYSVKEEYTLDAENISLRFAIPENLFMPTNGVTLDGLLIGDYTYSDGVLTVNTNKTSGTVRVCLYNILPAEKLNVSAKLYFTINETDRVQPVGSLDLKLSELEFYVPSETRQTNITATGTTFADAEVELFDNGTVVASAQSNKSGEFVIPFELYKPFSKTTHKIWVEVKAPGSVPIRSQVRTVEYDSNMPVLSKVYMSIGMNFWNTREVIIDFLNPSSSTVSYPGDYYGTTITYKVEFLGDVSLLHDVVVLAKIERKGDKPVEIPTVYDEETGMFVGVGKYCGHDFPEELSVSYDSDYSNPLSDMDALIEQYDLDSDYENTTERMQKYIDDDSAYVKMDEDGTKYMKFVEDDAYVEAKMSPDETENTVQMYLFDELIVTDKLKNNKAGSAGEAKAALTAKGYNVLTMDTSDCSLLGKLTDNSLCYAMVDGEGNYSELIRTYSDAYIEAIDEIFSNLYDDPAPAPASNKAAEPVGYDYDRSWIGRVAEFFTGNALVDQFNAYKELKRRYEKCRQNMASIGAQQPDGSVVPYSELLDHGGLLGKDEGGAGIEYWEHEKENAESHLLFQLGLSVLAVTFIGLGLFAVGTGGLVAGIALFSACSLICMAVSEAFKEKSYAEGATEGAVIATGGYSLYKGYEGVHAVPRPQLAISAGVGSLFTGVALVKNSTAIEQSLNNLESIANKCENAYDNRIKYYNPVRLRPLIDPSGYICEAVESNRVEGVTCTIFYSPNPDGSNAVVWNAEEAGQKNPQFSDSMGHYEWFVPEGYWQVKYEKEGYKTQYSDWLPVPPPQTEVNVAITSLKAPEIENIYAYQNEIDIEFSQYMNTYTVTDKTVSVSLNGEKVSGKIVPVNTEKGFNNPVINYATIFRFVPDESFSKDGVVTVCVENAANYADNAIKAFEDEFEVTLKPESIQADETVTLTMKDAVEIDIQVNPGEAGANQNVSVISGSSLIEILTPSVTTDENGKAKVRVRGVLPGEAEITYQLENSDCTGKTVLDIEMPIQKVEPVTASVKSGTTLNKGDKVYLSCATKGAEIYYTTDLSCPCILTSDARIKYTGPIEIKEYTTLIAYAVKDGMEDSRTTLFIYDVAPEPEKLPQVTASVESGSTVDRGTKISLSCDVEGAEIYYTTDMSCPCKTENPARTKYTHPIEINGDSTIIAYAVKDGMEDSKPKLFTYNVEEVLGDADGNGAFTISDVTYLQKYLAGMIEVNNASAAKWDYNNDGAVNISDATFLQRVLAGLETF
ncbi:MAG: chitobiase/beta-hexosaminidase C-terminal domain-containing protein, partial [Ruminococcus sp.]|nr:chitobiase/beta-hexosaminidase C-terminal domain-containing protein [Ruminococcus sp.]